MSEAAGPPEPRLYLRNLSVLLVESSPQEQEIVARILAGFGVRTVSRQPTAAAATAHLRQAPADLLVVAAALPGTDGYDFTRSFRFSALECRAAPVLLLTGHTRAADVHRARDCGASWVIAKPVTPRVLFHRIGWLARDERPFVETQAYTGPERRVRNLGPPPGAAGRRKDDLTLALGEATGANMSQAEIDALLNPRKAAR